MLHFFHFVFSSSPSSSEETIRTSTFQDIVSTYYDLHITGVGHVHDVDAGRCAVITDL